MSVSQVGPQGSQGPQGAQGQTGAQGPQGDTSNDVRVFGFAFNGFSELDDVALVLDGGTNEKSDYVTAGGRAYAITSMALSEPYVITAMHVAMGSYSGIGGGGGGPVLVSVMRASGAADASFDPILTINLGTMVDDYDAPSDTAVQLFAKDRITLRVHIENASFIINGSVTLRRGLATTS